MDKQIYTQPQMPQKPTKAEIAASLALLQGIAADDEKETSEQPETSEKKGLDSILEGINCCD